jgi:hypothetical protein
MIKKFKIFENDLDPFNEEDWEDKGMEGKRFKMAVFVVYSKNKKLYVNFQIMKANVYNVIRKNRDGEMIDFLDWFYIIEYEQYNGNYYPLPIGFKVFGWNHESIKVENIADVDFYVETMFRRTEKYLNNKCFVFEEDTHDDTVVSYCEKLYEKMKEKYENTKYHKDVHIKIRITKQD